ncbi:phosphomevalonate kinase [Sugiyamaella lignohabitans]|uniref:Phosphomevalonate kinase n=1 Tax=Sugiyamaella lignohabitans TaxID=796027 RepID=A0A167DY57_9ASCO|nr:phosphomevalonate kinase [Sugiyamaella lignohabitans]ANB13433.1 phosphomevalonate kinase [Sugiyamaella lignohabitans]
MVMALDSKAVAYSAPGKALLAGGYLVLLPQYSAYVVALSARIHAVVSEEEERANTHKRVTIAAYSPQFKDGEWVYSLGDGSDKSSLSPVLTSAYGNNPFLEAAIRTVVAYSHASGSRMLKKNVSIKIYSDDAYHSQDDRVTSPTTQSRFHYHLNSIRDVPKTGLGSSAALTTAVIAALFSFYLPDLDPLDPSNLDKVHNLAQLAHCTAQKKVGSGFDIASAVYGSVQYSRFAADIISNELFDPNSVESVDKFSNLVKNLVESDWKMTHIPSSLPPGLSLLMGDVKTGSETPKMASMVLDWREKNPARANEVWTLLDQSNTALVNTLYQMSTLAEKDPRSYAQLLEAGIEDSSPNILHQLRENFLEIRKYLRIMTIESHALIEPQPQTDLLDKCNQIPGVIGGVVPGAGGFDAISILALESKIQDIKDFTSKSKDSEFSDLIWLDLKEQRIGLQRESLSLYNNL